VFLEMNLGADFQKAATKLVNTGLLGKTRVSGLPYDLAGGSAIVVDTDYFGKKRNAAGPAAGPFESHEETKFKVW
jgi:hypothetical protein